MMDQIKALLVKADEQLDSISVKGSDAYRLVNARNLLKAVFDALQNVKQTEVSEDG